MVFQAISYRVWVPFLMQIIMNTGPSALQQCTTPFHWLQSPVVSWILLLSLSENYSLFQIIRNLPQSSWLFLSLLFAILPKEAFLTTLHIPCQFSLRQNFCLLNSIPACMGKASILLPGGFSLLPTLAHFLSAFDLSQNEGNFIIRDSLYIASAARYVACVGANERLCM